MTGENQARNAREEVARADECLAEARLLAGRTGELIWSVHLDNDVKSSPAFGLASILYVGSDSDHLHAIRPDGTRKWAFDTGRNVRSTPLIDGSGLLYVGANDDRLYALRIDPAADRVAWSLDLGGNVEAPPAIGSDRALYVGTRDEQLFAIGP